MKTGIELIVQERKEQIEKHNRTVEHDVHSNDQGQLRFAADFIISYIKFSPNPDNFKPEGWDIDYWSKLCKKSYRERLIIAGALIAAEIDRLQFKDEES